MGAWWEMILKQSKDNLFSILCSIGSQWREWSIGVTWADMVVLKMSLAAFFCTFWSLERRYTLPFGEVEDLSLHRYTLPFGEVEGLSLHRYTLPFGEAEDLSFHRYTLPLTCMEIYNFRDTLYVFALFTTSVLLLHWYTVHARIEVQLYTLRLWYFINTLIETHIFPPSATVILCD